MRRRRRRLLHLRLQLNKKNPHLRPPTQRNLLLKLRRKNSPKSLLLKPSLLKLSLLLKKPSLLKKLSLHLRNLLLPIPPPLLP